jgi:short subunit dehydrogenase-like uncharacterized protein
MNWMIYGANGYTGSLIARQAVKDGMSPILAGRNAEQISRLAAELGLQHRVFSLDDENALNGYLADCRLVLHCAGPFSATAKPMMKACLEAGAHYLDITGEIDVFALGHSLDEQARRADCVVIPGVGFDVVPTDCLAASLVDALPSATRLKLAFEAAGGPSRGTAKTSIEGMASGGRVRKDGQLKKVPLGWKSMEVPFAHGTRTAVTIPWGDVYTAWVSTGIPDIEVYMSVKPAIVSQLRRMRWLQPFLKSAWVQKTMKKRVDRGGRGPSGETRSRSKAEIWGTVSSADGRTVNATMSTPNGYDLTVIASLAIVRHLLETSVEGGYYTPSLLMGADFATRLPGVEMKLPA